MAYVLTPEGEAYLKTGLPEQQLCELLKKGPLTLQDASHQIQNFSIALQWTKKNRWITIEDGLLVLREKHPRFEHAEALERIHNQEHVDESLLTILEQRKLIALEKEGIVERAAKFKDQEVTHLTEELIKTGMWKEVTFKPYNVTAVGKKTHPGKKQHYLAFLDAMKIKLLSMGFQEMTGPLVETEFWNMDALYMPQHHSARDIHDAYFVKNPSHAEQLDKKILAAVKKSHESGSDGSRGWEYQYDTRRAHRHVLRTQTTALSARTLVNNPQIPGKYFAISHCFRYDVIDATHLPGFVQVEGIILDKGLTLRHLVGVLKTFAKEFANAEKIKIVPGYFPFTEPSVELHAKHPQLGWIELGGAGIFRKEMTKPLGIGVPVIAWGLGIDRIGMFNMGIKDIRDLISTDLQYLRSAPVIY